VESQSRYGGEGKKSPEGRRVRKLGKEEFVRRGERGQPPGETTNDNLKKQRV